MTGSKRPSETGVGRPFRAPATRQCQSATLFDIQAVAEAESSGANLGVQWKYLLRLSEGACPAVATCDAQDERCCLVVRPLLKQVATEQDPSRMSCLAVALSTSTDGDWVRCVQRKAAESVDRYVAARNLYGCINERLQVNIHHRSS